MARPELNHKIGKFCISNIRSAPKGVEKINVKFEIDADGVLGVTATSVSTGQSEGLIVSSDVMNLSKEEISQIRLRNRLSRATFTESIAEQSTASVSSPSYS